MLLVVVTAREDFFSSVFPKQTKGPEYAVCKNLRKSANCTQVYMTSECMKLEYFYPQVMYLPGRSVNTFFHL